MLRDSTNACGAELHAVSNGGYNPMKSVVDMMEHLQRLPHEYVVATDAYDTMMCRWDEDEVTAAIDAQVSGLLVSCEVNCYPAGPWGTAYGTPLTPWWYCNGGQMAGRRDALLQLWSEYISGRWPVECGGGTQEMLHRMYASGREFGRDTTCNIFQNMTDSLGAVVCHNGVVTNGMTGTRPMCLHWSGRMPGMQKFYTKWRERA